VKETWRKMLIALATEERPLKPGRAYFIATGDNRLYGSHRGRPALQAMERRGWVKQHVPGFGGVSFIPASQLRPGEDSGYSITEKGYEALEEEGFPRGGLKRVRETWGR
jgi:hypothetical protein